MTAATPTATDEGAYADRLQAAFAEVCASVGSVRHDLEFGGRAVRLEVAGRALADRLVPALAHLRAPTPHAAPEFTVQAWDRHGTGRPAPPPPWGIDRYGPREQIVGLDPARLRASYELASGILSLHRPGSAVATFYAADAATIPRWVARMPFRRLLGWFAEDAGLTFAHASVVGRDGACVLLPGNSGSGKSTTALACAEAGFDFLGDDLCLIDPDALIAHAAYGRAKAEADAVARVPALAARVLATEAGQSLIEPPNLVSRARIVGIALPAITGEPATSTRPARPSEAVFALAPSTLVEGNGAGQVSLATLARIAGQLPVAHLQLGTDMAGVVAAVDELIARWSP